MFEDVAEAAGAFGANALRVHANRDYADAVRGGSLDAVGVGEVFNEHVVAAFAEEGYCFAEAVGVAARQQGLRVGVRDAATVQVVQGEVGNKRTERWESVHGGVLQRSGDVDGSPRVHGGGELRD